VSFTQCNPHISSLYGQFKQLYPAAEAQHLIVETTSQVCE